jgi:hypothetical protein
MFSEPAKPLPNICLDIIGDTQNLIGGKIMLVGFKFLQSDKNDKYIQMVRLL